MMTICLAINFRDVIYVAADSMVTGAIPKLPVSAAGERLAATPFGPIADRGWKVYPIGKSGILTYSGSVTTGGAIAEILQDNLDETYEPLDILKAAIRSAKPISADRAVDMLFAFQTAGSPKLAFYDYDSDEIYDVPPNQWRIIGSVPDKSRHAINKLVEDTLNLSPIGRSHPEEVLTVILALLMTNARFFDLAEHGIGGAFCGAYVAPSGRGWQPDILYHPYAATKTGSGRSGEVLHTMVRDNNFVIGTGAQRSTIRVWQSDDWDSKWLDFLTNYPDFGRTDYFVFYNTGKEHHRCVIVQMHKRRATSYVQLVPSGNKMQLRVSNGVEKELLRSKHGFAFAAFEPNPNAPYNVGDAVASVLYDTLPRPVARLVFDKMLQALESESKYSDENQHIATE